MIITTTKHLRQLNYKEKRLAEVTVLKLQVQDCEVGGIGEEHADHVTRWEAKRVVGPVKAL